MTTTSQRPKFTLDDVVSALTAHPPRTRSALQGLRWMFENPTDTPHTLLLSCAQMLNTDDATSPDILEAVRNVAAELGDYDDTERRMFHACVYTSETRRTVAVTELSDITAMVRATPPQRNTALDALRWIDAATRGGQRALFTACAALLKDPSATAPAIVNAIRTGHQMWPTLDSDARALLMACVYASTERADTARRRQAAQAEQREADTGDVHRCGNCDGNLADTPDLPYCSEFCRREAESTERPKPAAPRHAHVPAEVRAQHKLVIGPVEAEYDAQYRKIEHAISRVALVRKDHRVSDAYDDERQRHRDTEERPDDTEQGWTLSEEDYQRLALRGVSPDALCAACNLERTPTEHRDPGTDHRCEECRDRARVPLDVIGRELRLAATATEPAREIVETLRALDALDVLDTLSTKPPTAEHTRPRELAAA